MDTVFNKIVSGEVPCYKVLEDTFHVAFLDIFPEVSGQVVVIPKTQTTSKFSESASEILASTTLFAQQVASVMEQKLPNVLRVIVKIEGMDIDYLHIKLYPIYFDANHVPSVSNSKASDEELSRLQSILIK